MPPAGVCDGYRKRNCGARRGRRRAQPAPAARQMAQRRQAGTRRKPLSATACGPYQPKIPFLPVLVRCASGAAGRRRQRKRAVQFVNHPNGTALLSYSSRFRPRSAARKSQLRCLFDRPSGQTKEVPGHDARRTPPLVKLLERNRLRVRVMSTPPILIFYASGTAHRGTPGSVMNRS